MQFFLCLLINTYLKNIPCTAFTVLRINGLIENWLNVVKTDVSHNEAWGVGVGVGGTPIYIYSLYGDVPPNRV